MQFSNKYVVSAAVLAVAGAGIYSFVLQGEAERPGQVVEIQGGGHIPAKAPTPEYNSNPPTSGPHSSSVRGGFYSAGVKDIFGVHNLEHGYIWITYKNVDAETVKTLKTLSQSYSGSVVVSLRSANDAPLVLTSWGRIMKMDALDEKTIIDFIQKNKNKSPERLAR